MRPKWRRLGVAGKLIAQAEQQTREWGFSELLLNVQQGNMPARSLYSGLGYREVPQRGEEKGMFDWLLKSQRQLWMQKELV